MNAAGTANDERNGVMQHPKEISDIILALGGVHKAIARHGLEPGLQHLVWLRASQINRCGFCVDMHIREAREDGETAERLDKLIVWDQMAQFSEREKAALAWTEALTGLDPHVDRARLRERLQRHFSEEDIAVLTITIAMINLWNRINVSKH